MIQTNSLHLFAGVPVTDYATAVKWYEQLLGFPPTFYPNEKEAVWKVAEFRYLYIVREPENAGHARLTLFIENLDEIAEQINARGIDPAKQDDHANGVRKLTYRDADGNEIGFGGGPNRSSSEPKAST